MVPAFAYGAMFTKLVLGISLLPAVLSTGPQSASRLHKDAGYMPITSVDAPLVSVSGQTIPMTVNLVSAASKDQTVTLSACESGAFSSMPASMVIPAGQSCGTVYVTISSSWVGEADIYFGSGMYGNFGSTIVSLPLGFRPNKLAHKN